MNAKLVTTLAILLISATTFFSFGLDSKISNLIKEKKLYDLAENSFRSFARSSCNKPLAYKIGEVDPRFNISKDKLELLLKEAEDIWERKTGKNLFVYSSDNEDAVNVNMIFDERQENLISENMSRSQLEKKWGSYETLKDTYEKLIYEYENSRDSFDRKTTSYNSELSAYNKKINLWNRDGGSESEYKALLKDKEKIDSLFSQLDREQKEIIKTSQKLKELGEVLNRLYDNFSKETDDHNSNLDSRIVEVGLFDLYQINIYQYDTNDDLRWTLVHEMGHSLGLDHVEGEQSIMYYLHPELTPKIPELSENDLKELNEVCNF